MVQQQYGETDTMPVPESTASTQRYEEARAAAHRAMTSVNVIPDRPLPGDPEEPQSLSYRGFKFGAAFFGWLVSLPMAVLLIGGTGAAILGGSYVLDYTRSDAEAQAGTVALVLTVTLGVLVALAFFTGGYVAGRLARFDGSRQGFGVWMIAFLLSIVAAAGGAYLDNEYDLLGRVDRPDVPLAADTLTSGAMIAGAALVIVTLLAALLGGRSGQRYHEKIDSLLP
ncbi:hypothetical protein FB561_6501 [Kribbella amoyensis]|uniref:Uncharacterized protein n=1 Tax=Kribbella amoyensis TaxID=996641 RepID=A0A561B7X6_9ACTN|nr:hypothetical protein FB561_6501 [Kribbella amoyensis]